MDERAFTTQVAARLGCDERRATDVTFAVFQELRDRLTPEEADDVAAQLPTPLKRLWEVGERPGREVRRTHKPEFVAAVRAQVGLADDAAAERAVHGVFAVLQRALGSRTGREGEAGDVLSQLPMDLKALWLAAGKSP
jgi:uncharacterized protein (DUF2267 family)